MLILTKDFLRYRQELISFYHEWKQSGEEFVPMNLGMVDPEINFQEFISYMHVDFGDDYPVSDIYICIDTSTSKMVGAVDIRSECVNHSEIFGDIGYGVRPSCRSLGIATQMVGLALEMISSYREYVYIACVSDNLASKHLIEKLNSTLYNTYTMNGKTHLVYRIGLRD